MNGSANQSGLKNWHRYSFTCIGALMPLIMSLYYSDLAVFLQKITPTIFFGYLIKVIILLVLGFLIGAFYRTETNRLKLFQLGIAAPAIVLGVINGQGTKLSEGDTNIDRTSFFSINILNDSFDRGFFNHQQDTSIRFHDAKILQYGYPQESVKQQFLRGFMGKKITNMWFLIYGSYPNRQEATNTIVQLKDRYPELEAQLYKSIKDTTKYDVVLGDHLEYQKGQVLQKKYSSLLEKNIELWEYNPELFKDEE